MGDIPLMTDRGTLLSMVPNAFVVSQIHRSPGVIFSHEKAYIPVESSRIGEAGLNSRLTRKKNWVYAKIDRKKRILGTLFLRALGYQTREDIIRCFYITEKVKVSDSRDKREHLIGKILASAVYITDDNGEQKKLYRAGEKMHPHNIDELMMNKIPEIEVINFEHPDSLNSPMIINCFEREEIRYSGKDSESDEPSKDDDISAVYSVLMPGEPITVEAAEKDLVSSSSRHGRYDLGRVGRYKLNKKSITQIPVSDYTLVKQDIIATMKFLIKVYVGDESIDDIDHPRTVVSRSVGELMTNTLKTAFSEWRRIAKERMSLKETETIKAAGSYFH